MAAEHRHFDRLDSTNRYLKEWVSKSDPSHGSMVTADYQSQGRGQYGRTWSAAPGENLLMSVLLKPQDLPPSQAYWITVRAATALIDSLQQYVSTPLKAKWPNDVYTQGRKLAGILTESSVQNHQVAYVVLGIGVNILQRIWPEDMRIPPVSISELTDTSPSKTELAQDVRARLLHSLDQPLDQIISRYNYLLYGRDESWTFQVDQREHTAQLSHLDQDGHLHFYSDSGQRWYTPAWEVRDMSLTKNR